MFNVCHAIAVEDNVLSAEASELGLSPGVWPTELYTLAVIPDQPLPLPILFLRKEPIHSDKSGEFGGYNYLSDGGLIKLVVWND